MEQILQLSDTLKTGLFIINAQKKDYIPFRANNVVYLTQESNIALKAEILKMIRETKEVIKICSFILTDREIFEALLQRAKEYSIAIFILTQLDPSKLKNTSVLSDHITDEELRENPAQTHLFFIKSLFDQGVHVRAATTAHAKFIISDRKKAMLMSANLTTPSLNFNTESGVYLNPSTVDDIDRLFDVIFQHGTKYRQYLTASRNKAFVVQSSENISPHHLSLNPKSLLRFTYEQHTHHLYQTIVDYIRQAKQYLYISTYSIVGLENLPDFIQELQQAISRNVDVHIFCRGMNYRNDHLKNCQILSLMGCKIYGDVYNHSKGVINESQAMIFTANIDGNHGLINGFEVGCILTEQQREIFLQFHIDLINSSPYLFDSEPTRKDFFETYSAYEALKGITPPGFPTELHICRDQNLKVNQDELEKHPIFFAQQKDHKFLLVGQTLYKCHYQLGKFTLLSKEQMRYDLEKYILKYNNLKINLN
jgi:hypothetical protein